MRLDPDALVFGVAPRIMMDCAQQLRDHDSFAMRDFCKAIGAPLDEARPVLEVIVGKGYLLRKKIKGRIVFEPTQKFRQLAVASITKGISRARAEELLRGIVDRAKEINTRPDEFQNAVTRLAVFGSYLTDAPVLGDLDVGFELKPVVRPKRMKIRYHDILKDLPRRKTVSFLRKRNRKEISLHTWEEVVGRKTPYRVVFGSK